MIRLCFLLPAVLTSITCMSQQRELDSLLHLLNNHRGEDTVRLQLLNDIAFDYSHIDPLKGSAIADEALLLAKKLGSIKKMAAANTYKAMNLAAMGEDSLSLEYYQQALALHHQTNDQLHVATTYNNMAIAFVNLSDYIKALQYHERAFRIFEQLGDKVRMGNSLNNRGVIYLYLSDYSQALKYHLDALAIFDQLNNKQVTAATLMNIGLVYDHLADFTRALQYQQQAYDIYRQDGDNRGMINAMGNIGNVYHNMERDTEALDHYRRALQLSEQIGDRRGIASNTSNMGIVYRDMGQYEEALRHLEKSLQLNTQAGDKKRIAGDLIEMGKVYFGWPDTLGAIHPGDAARTARAIDLAHKSLGIAREIGSLDIQRESLELLSKAYQQQHDPTASLQAYKEYIVMRDSVMNSEVKQKIMRRELQFEYEKREVELKAAQQRRQAAAEAALRQQRLVKNGTLVIASVTLAATLISFVFYKRKRDADIRSREAAFRLKEADIQMDVLRLQMNPHFIFNSLNSINSYIDDHDTAKATLFTTKFARLMRMTLESSARKEVRLSDDLAALELYLQLESLRLAHSFSYEIRVDSRIDPGETMVPPMLLQPFVENSIWHGVSRKKDGHILISIVSEEEMIRCIVEDNGVGRHQAHEAAAGRKSMGIAITRKRIEILNQIKQSSASVALHDLDQGVRAEVTVPYGRWS